ncbi:MAG: hypothetical protein EOM37_12990 [Proteobacteria bacterium]|nr:hypothetical protein [Pseudomonadota bacterium]
MLKDKWLNRGFVPSVNIVLGGGNQNSVPERKNITSNRVFQLLDKTDKTYKTPHPVNIPIPPTLDEDLLCCGYYAPEWTPAGCRRFLAELMREWPGFEVRGWHGCEFPECWPVALMDAVESVYVMSIQDHVEVEA